MKRKSIFVIFFLNCLYLYSQGTNVFRNEVFIKGGSFKMGDDYGDSDTSPSHNVNISDFYIMKYEVSQSDYYILMGNNPSSYTSGDLSSIPVDSVTWEKAVLYANALSKEYGLEPTYITIGNHTLCNFLASGWRLPTEAEWEYAARGGLLSKNYQYCGSDDIDLVAWHQGSDLKIMGTKDPNELGLYDMSGSVTEWCWDWYNKYSDNTQNDPIGPVYGPNGRVVRGGNTKSSMGLYVYSRSYDSPNSSYSGNGFRLVRSDPRNTIINSSKVYNFPKDNYQKKIIGGTFLDRKTKALISVPEFYLSIYETTIEDFYYFLNDTGRFVTAKTKLPILITWKEAIEYCNWRSYREGLNLVYSFDGDFRCNFEANGYRLPTEAEWEYACRAGTTTLYSFGDKINNKQVNFSSRALVAVGNLPANPWGLFEMHGNAPEWCWNEYDRRNEKGIGYITNINHFGSNHIVRGGSYDSDAENVFSHSRYADDDNQRKGFRLARSTTISQEFQPNLDKSEKYLENGNSLKSMLDNITESESDISQNENIKTLSDEEDIRLLSWLRKVYSSKNESVTGYEITSIKRNNNSITVSGLVLINDLSSGIAVRKKAIFIADNI